MTFGASEPPVTLREGDFTVVDTEDHIPEGCDEVVMVEDVIRQEDGTVRLYAPPPLGSTSNRSARTSAPERGSHVRMSPAVLGIQGKRPVLGVPGYLISGILVPTELLHPLISQ